MKVRKLLSLCLALCVFGSLKPADSRFRVARTSTTSSDAADWAVGRGSPVGLADDGDLHTGGTEATGEILLVPGQSSSPPRRQFGVKELTSDSYQALPRGDAVLRKAEDMIAKRKAAIMWNFTHHGDPKFAIDRARYRGLSDGEKNLVFFFGIDSYRMLTRRGRSRELPVVTPQQLITLILQKAPYFVDGRNDAIVLRQDLVAEVLSEVGGLERGADEEAIDVADLVAFAQTQKPQFEGVEDDAMFGYIMRGFAWTAAELLRRWQTFEAEERGNSFDELLHTFYHDFSLIAMNAIARSIHTNGGHSGGGGGGTGGGS